MELVALSPRTLGQIRSNGHYADIEGQHAGREARCDLARSRLFIQVKSGRRYTSLRNAVENGQLISWPLLFFSLDPKFSASIRNAAPQN